MRISERGPLLGCWASGSAAAAPCDPATATPWLHVQGNQIKDPGGRNVTLRGVSILSPEHNAECHYCNSKPIKTLIDMTCDTTQGWYSRVLRLPITTRYEKDPAASFTKYIDPYVQHAISKGLYVIVDLHFVSDYDVNGSGGISQQYVLPGRGSAGRIGFSTTFGSRRISTTTGISLAANTKENS